MYTYDDDLECVDIDSDDLDFEGNLEELDFD